MKKFISFTALILIALTACSAPKVNHRTADRSTFELFRVTESLGTAWVVAPHYLMTAGHMCWVDPATDKGVEYVAKDSNDRVVRAEPVMWEMSLDPSADLCVLHTDARLPPPLRLADAMPAIGAPVFYNGYPLGVYTSSDGKYAGGGASDAPCDHGSSGSAMESAGGVWGVLVQLRQDGGDGCVATPLPEIKRFLSELGLDSELAL